MPATNPNRTGGALQYSLVSPPAGATIDARTGQLTWTPASAGSYTVNVRVTDTASGLSTTKGVSVLVLPKLVTLPALPPSLPGIRLL